MMPLPRSRVAIIGGALVMALATSGDARRISGASHPESVRLMGYLVLCTGEPESLPGLYQPRMFMAKDEEDLDAQLNKALGDTFRVTERYPYHMMQAIPIGAWWTVSGVLGGSCGRVLAYVVKVGTQVVRPAVGPGATVLQDLPGSNVPF